MSRKYFSLEHLAKRINQRKKLFKAVPYHTTKKIQLPVNADLKTYCSKLTSILPYDQGQLGSCTANAFCGAYCLLEQIKQGSATFHPSRLYVYFYERLEEDPKHNQKDLSDTGGDVVDGVSYIQQFGVCQESLWPYDDTNEQTKPNLSSYPYDTPPKSDYKTDASKHKISTYHTIPIDEELVNNIKQSIVNKTPVLIAVAVYKSFESEITAKTGHVTIPNPLNYNDPNDSRDPFLGGHEMCLIGYDDKTKSFLVMNSWGSKWGQGGLCLMPYDYLTNSNLGLEFTVFDL